MKQKWNLKTTDLTKIALLVALLSVSSYIIIPLPFTAVSITAQTLVINLIALILTPVQTAITVGTWILLGLAGVPVFSGGAGGPGKLFGQTGGYIFGYWAAAIVISILKGKKNELVRYCITTIIPGMLIIDTLGLLYLKFLTGIGWKTAFVSAVLPFIPLDVMKCIAASIIAVALNKAFLRSGNSSVRSIKE